MFASQYSIIPRFNANIMAGWHYGEGGDLHVGLWIWELIIINSDTYVLMHFVYNNAKKTVGLM